MSKDNTLTLAPDGALTIPADILARAGLSRGTEVELVIDGATLSLRRKRASREDEAVADWIDRITGIADAGMTTDEIMALTRGED